MPDLCQWLTPPGVARKFLAWTGIRDQDLVLEPAAGEGALVPDRPGVLAFEVDPLLYRELRYWRPESLTLCCDFLTVEPVPGLVDVAVLNPPYSNQGEAVFLRQSLLWAPRAFALVRAVALHGTKRQEQGWQHVRLVRMAVLSRRPRYLGPGGLPTPFNPEADFIAIECARRTDDGPDEVKVEWVDWA